MTGLGKKAVFIGSTQVLVDCIKQWVTSGGEVEAVISDCNEVETWSSTAGISLESPKQNLPEMLSDRPFDYLFSIPSVCFNKPNVKVSEPVYLSSSAPIFLPLR